MERDSLIKICRPEELSLREMENLMVDYPWFSLLRIIWLIKIKNQKPERFSAELRKNSIFLRDRKRFYQLVHNPQSLEFITEFLKKNDIDTGIDEDSVPSGDLLDFSWQEKSGTEESPSEDKESLSSETNDYSSGTKDQSPSLIDRFLEKSPGVIRADKETRLSGDVSEKSIKESDNFLTDKLAKIYIKQGLYTKAIFAYKKLSLKYPEKSAYFAAQIEDIENLIKNK